MRMPLLNLKKWLCFAVVGKLYVPFLTVSVNTLHECSLTPSRQYTLNSRFSLYFSQKEVYCLLFQKLTSHHSPQKVQPVVPMVLKAATCVISCLLKSLLGTVFEALNCIFGFLAPVPPLFIFSRFPLGTRDRCFIAFHRIKLWEPKQSTSELCCQEPFSPAPPPTSEATAL